MSDIVATSWFDETFERIKQNKEIKESGGFNSIPFGLPSLDKHIRIIQGCQYIVTANSGIGKTQLAKFLFVNQAYKFVKEHPESGIKLRIFWFAHEESKHEFMLTLICNRLREKYGIVMNVMDLESMKDASLSDQVLQKVSECRQYFEELSQVLQVIDHVSNPFGIYKHVREYARANGKFYLGGVEVTEPGGMYDTYIANDPLEYVIVANDHIGLLQPEATTDTNTLYGAMSKWSAEYCRKNISKHFKYIPVNVQQQSAEKEKLQFTMKGDSIEQKLEPSLDGLGENKTTQRDALVVLGLFAPERYRIENYMGYDITKLGDNFRALIMLKNRIGRPNLRKGLFFDGETNTFKELPEAQSEEMKRMYEIMGR